MYKTKLVLFFTISLLFLTNVVAADVKTVDNFFDSIEKKTNLIDTVAVSVELTNNSSVTTKASLTIKSPDKFAIEFEDESIQVFYNGVELWLYIGDLKEVFYHKFNEKKNFMPSCLSFISPKKIFVKLTRSTLKSLFTIDFKEKKEVAEDSYYDFTFKPSFLGVMKKVLGANYYIITFSKKQGLPTSVIEMSEKDKELGRLKVVEYKINEEIPDKYFNYKVKAGTFTLPLSTVIAQKLEQYVDTVKKKTYEAIDSIKNIFW